MTSDEDVVTTEPTVTGPHGRAWRLDLEKRRQRRPVPGGDAAIDEWIIEAPWAHPVWHSYVIVLMHLRPMGDERDAQTIFYLPGATHEMWVYALDPEQPRQAVIDGEMFQQLEPANFAAQFIADADDLAQARIYASVTEIVNGTLSPDTDFLRMWIGLYGGNMIKGAA